MEFANICLVISLVLASFRKFSHAENYKLHEVQSITPIHAGGKMKYLEKHPMADTDGIPEGQRMEMCLTALERFRDEHPSRISELKKDEQPSTEMKPYFIVHSIFGGLMSHYQVLPAYPCPVFPPMFIHLDIDATKNEQSFEIMFAKPQPRPKLDNFETFHMLIAEDMYDADAEKIESMKAADINTSLYDFDHQIDERQRYRLCERASMIIPTEQSFRIFENQPTGRTEFKIIKVKSPNREDANEEFLMQLFDCPTLPKISVHVDGSQLEKNLWTVVKETDLDQPPSHKVVQYDLLSVPNIEIYENARIEEEKELIEKQRAEKKKFANIILSKEVDSYVMSRELEKLDFNAIIKKRKVIVEAAIDTDSELTEEERYSICAKAIKIISGKEAALEWLDSINTTHKHYYSIEPEKGDAEAELDIVNAYPCPTKDGVFEGQILVHIGSLPDKNRAVTLITGNADAKRLTTEF